MKKTLERKLYHLGLVPDDPTLFTNENIKCLNEHNNYMEKTSEIRRETKISVMVLQKKKKINTEVKIKSKFKNERKVGGVRCSSFDCILRTMKELMSIINHLCCGSRILIHNLMFSTQIDHINSRCTLKSSNKIDYASSEMASI